MTDHEREEALKKYESLLEQVRTKARVNSNGIVEGVEEAVRIAKSYKINIDSLVVAVRDVAKRSLEDSLNILESGLIEDRMYEDIAMRSGEILGASREVADRIYQSTLKGLNKGILRDLEPLEQGREGLVYEAFVERIVDKIQRYYYLVDLKLVERAGNILESEFLVTKLRKEGLDPKTFIKRLTSPQVDFFAGDVKPRGLLPYILLDGTKWEDPTSEVKYKNLVRKVEKKKGLGSGEGRDPPEGVRLTIPLPERESPVKPPIMIRTSEGVVRETPVPQRKLNSHEPLTGAYTPRRINLMYPFMSGGKLVRNFVKLERGERDPWYLELKRRVMDDFGLEEAAGRVTALPQESSGVWKNLTGIQKLTYVGFNIVEFFRDFYKEVRETFQEEESDK